MHIVVLTTDLICSSQLEGAARAAGATLEAAPTVDRLLERTEASPGAVVVLDLNVNVDLALVVGALKGGAHPPRAVLAFGPHVHESRLVAAQAAGCDQVLVRGAFYAQAAEIFGRYTRGA